MLAWKKVVHRLGRQHLERFLSEYDDQQLNKIEHVQEEPWKMLKSRFKNLLTKK